jgi:hypothetical protein
MSLDDAIWGIDLIRQVETIQQSLNCVCIFFCIYTFLFFCFQLPHVFINCVECFSLRLLLEQILNKLSRLSSPEEGCSEITCETFNDFVRLFKQVTQAESLKSQTVYIVSSFDYIISCLQTDCTLDEFPYIYFESCFIQCCIRCFWDTKCIRNIIYLKETLIEEL